MPTHEAKPKTWQEAAWLPLLVAAGVVGVLFLIGLDYNNKVKAQKKADYEAKNGILPQNTEGSHGVFPMKGWQAANCSVIAFLQDKKTGQVLGAAKMGLK